MEVKHCTPQRLLDFQKECWEELGRISEPCCRRAREEFQVELIPAMEEFADKRGREIPYSFAGDERIPGGYRCDLRMWVCREGHVLAFGPEGDTLSTSTTIAWKPADGFFLSGEPVYLEEDWKNAHLEALEDLLKALAEEGEGTPLEGEEAPQLRRPVWEKQD